MSVQVPSDHFYVTDRMFKPLHGTTASSLTSRFLCIAAKAGLRIENDGNYYLNLSNMCTIFSTKNIKQQ